jgi:hypothetical protein
VAKRQCVKAGIGFTELSNGFARCTDPAGLQAICVRLGPADIQAFADRWLQVLPLPLTVSDQAAGYWWELSLRQVEVSRTIVFDAPRRARGFVEALVADNLDLGRRTAWDSSSPVNGPGAGRCGRGEDSITQGAAPLRPDVEALQVSASSLATCRRTSAGC